MPISPYLVEDSDEFQKAALKRKLEKFYGASSDEPDILQKLASISSNPTKAFLGKLADKGSFDEAKQAAGEQFGEAGRVYPSLPSYSETAGKVGIEDKPFIDKEEYETLEAQDPMAARDSRFWSQMSKQKLAGTVADVALDPIQYFPAGKVAGLAGKFSMIAPGIIKEIATGKLIPFKKFSEMIDAGKAEGLLWHGTNTRTMRGAKEAEELAPAADPRRAGSRVVDMPDPEYTLLSKEPGHVKGSLEHYYSNPESNYRTGVSQADIEKEGALFAVDPAKKGNMISAIDQSGNAKPISYNLEGELPTPSTSQIGDIYSAETLSPKYRITDEDIAKVLKKMGQKSEIPGVKNIERVKPDLVAESTYFNPEDMSGTVTLKDRAMGDRKAGSFKFGEADEPGTIHSNDFTEIDPYYRSLGGTKKMYNKAEEVSGQTMVASDIQLPGGKKVWKDTLETPPENIIPYGETDHVGIGKKKIAENLADAEEEISTRGGSYKARPEPVPLRLTAGQQSHLDELRSGGGEDYARRLERIAGSHSDNRDLVKQVFKAQNPGLGPYVDVPGVGMVPNYQSKLTNRLGDGPPLQFNQDPFQWSDSTSGATKRLLNQANSIDHPLEIHTMSDLVGRKDYASKIPKGSVVNMYVVPESMYGDAESALLPGVPSSRRNLSAATKLKEKGVTVNVITLTNDQIRSMAKANGVDAKTLKHFGLK